MTVLLWLIQKIAPITNLVGLLVLLSELVYNDIGIGIHVYVLAGGLALAGFVLGFTNWALDVPQKILLDQIAGATLQQPRGQRPIGDAPWHVSTRRHLFPAAVLRGGGGIRGGENVRMFVQLLQFLQFMLCHRQAHLIPASRRKHQRGMILY